MPPSIVAGLRPAAARLAQRPPSDRDTSVALHRLLPAMLTQTARSAVSIPTTGRSAPIRSHRSPYRPRSNPHRAPPPPAPIRPAISSFGGFRTPATVRTATFAMAGIRNPSHNRTCYSKRQSAFGTSLLIFTRGSWLAPGGGDRSLRGETRIALPRSLAVPC
jgi:hypothetical protein